MLQSSQIIMKDEDTIARFTHFRAQGWSFALNQLRSCAGIEGPATSAKEVGGGNS